MDDVTRELAEAIVRAARYVELVGSQLEPIQPEEEAIGTLDMIGQTVFAAKIVSDSALRAYINEGHGSVRADGMAFVPKDTPTDVIRQIALLRARNQLLRAAFTLTLARAVPDDRLTHRIEIRQGFTIVDIEKALQREALLAEAEQSVRTEDLTPQ